MPLNKSSSKVAVGENIKAELQAGKPRKQAIAIALETQRRAGGGKKKSRTRHTPKMVHDFDSDGE